MFDWKFFADLVTVFRVLVGVWIAWLGWRIGDAALPQAVAGMLVCWTGDYLDGHLARRAHPQRHNWLGDHDVILDVCVSLCVGGHLLLAGWVDGKLALIYLFVWALVFWVAGQNHALLMLVQAPIYGYFIFVALSQAPQTGWWLLAWIAVMLIFNWGRFSTQVVPGFLREMQDAWRRLRSN